MHFCSLSLLVCGILLRQLEHTNTHGKRSFDSKRESMARKRRGLKFQPWSSPNAGWQGWGVNVESAKETRKERPRGEVRGNTAEHVVLEDRGGEPKGAGREPKGAGWAQPCQMVPRAPARHRCWSGGRHWCVQQNCQCSGQVRRKQELRMGGRMAVLWRRYNLKTK